jgi:formylglycine-generating enzyme required for sulfatase activity
MMPKVFICYRRDDSAYPAHQIYGVLTNHYGADSVVFDVDTIPLGADFREYLNNQVSQCDVLLAVIGDRWAEMLKQRMDDADDYVRIEIQAALERDIPVVPILVGRASVPSVKDLPNELMKLAYRHGAEVRAGPDLQTHLERLIRGLDHLLAKCKAEEVRKQNEAEEAKRKAEETERRKEAEQRAARLRRAEEERKRKEIEARRKAEEESKRKEAERTRKNLVERAAKPPKTEPEKSIAANPSEPSPSKKFTNSIGMEFVLIPAGSFTMGSNTGYDNEKPPRDVKISQSFYLQATEVTQGQWKKVMGDNPSYFKQCGDDCPVEQVSWEDAQRFIEKLNQVEKTKAYRLPTEAEWEYACRSGTTTEYSFGDDAGKLGEYAWYGDNSSKTTQRVAGKKPNPWGLYDMHGNVWEWVEDDWHGSYKGAPGDSSAWIDDPRGSNRVLRGGCWSSDARYCRSATRDSFRPGVRVDFVGFRLSRFVSLGP